MKKDNHSENVSSSNQNKGDSNKNPELPNDKAIENKKEQILMLENGEVGQNSLMFMPTMKVFFYWESFHFNSNNRVNK